MEVIAAVFVFLLGIVGILSLFAAAAVLNKSAKMRTDISLVNERVIAEIDQYLKEDPKRDGKGDLLPMDDRPVPNRPRFTYRAKFTEESGTGRRLVTAVMAINWKDKGKERAERFDHVFRPGPSMRSVVERFRDEPSRMTPAVSEGISPGDSNTPSPEDNGDR